MQGLQVLLQIQSNKLHESSLVTRVSMGAIAFQPDESVGTPTWLTVDGEVVPMEPMLLEVHKGLLRLICAPTTHA
jgi:hypothetical protein